MGAEGPVLEREAARSRGTRYPEKARFGSHAEAGLGPFNPIKRPPRMSHERVIAYAGNSQDTMFKETTGIHPSIAPSAPLETDSDIST
jgi:hypothetical protein